MRKIPLRVRLRGIWEEKYGNGCGQKTSKSSLRRHISIRELVIAVAASKEDSAGALYLFSRQNQDIFRPFQ